jgi:xylulose-5-phosphate/fructose-6-phosphate phosphoketolase
VRPISVIPRAEVAAHVPGLGSESAYVKQAMRDKLVAHEQFIVRHGKDMPEVAEWTWSRG